MKRRTSGLYSLHAGMAAAVLCTAVGCAAGPGRVPQAPMGARTAESPAAPPVNTAALDELSAQRRAEHHDGDYVLGEGDVITIRAYDLDEMNQKVRVDGDGSISLPLLDSVPVAGRSVSEVQQDLTKRLGAFMYDPHVTVFVEEYRSQQVAVQGAVQKPGLVPQMQRTATVRDALAAAGGMTAEAGSRVYLIPGDHRSKTDGQAGLPEAGAANVEGEGLADAVMMDTHETDTDTQQRFLDLPVRAGDQIVIPNRGKFIAEGWVEKPGIYPLNPGLTVRGAIATAGGLTFPASTRIRICHPGANGETEMRELNYSAVTSLQAPDVFIHDGDVIAVTYTMAKVIPWSFYKVVAEFFHLGMKVAQP
jgi:polysaccharide export outer membrane protein